MGERIVGYESKPWTKSYKLGPYKLDESLAPFPKVPVYKALDDAAKKYPNKTAILFLKREIKYKALKEQADRLANGLARLGINKGDKVGLFLPNCPEAIIGDWGILKAGAATIPISTLRTDDGIVHEAGKAKAKAIICREDQVERLWALKSRCSFEYLIVTSLDGYDISDVTSKMPEGAISFKTLLDKSDPEPPKIEIDPEEDLCELAFTGGATGLPKGVMVTHYNRYCCIQQGFPWIFKPMIGAIKGKSSILIPVPLFHSYGRYMIQTAAYLALRIVLIPDPRDIDEIIEHIKTYRPMMLTAVPTQLMRIAQKKVGKMNLMPMSGAAPLPVEVADAIKKELGSPVSEGYGLTETSPLTHFNISSFSKITGFMPKEKHGLGVPAPDTECKLLDPDTGKEVPFGESGEIFLRGPQIMKGYWPKKGSGLTEDGWLATGDIAFMDKDGYFHMTDRIKDMVNVSGNKVYSTQVDEVLFKHPAVLVAAAFAVPDPNLPGSERVMASIQLKNEFKGKVSDDDIKDYCRKHLAPYAVPKYVEFRDEMPMTVTEKVFKKVLREEAVQKLKTNKGEA
jgi:long-chain acyl-CoA synthetase